MSVHRRVLVPAVIVVATTGASAALASAQPVQTHFVRQAHVAAPQPPRTPSGGSDALLIVGLGAVSVAAVAGGGIAIRRARGPLSAAR